MFSILKDKKNTAVERFSCRPVLLFTQNTVIELKDDSFSLRLCAKLLPEISQCVSFD